MLLQQMFKTFESYCVMNIHEIVLEQSIPVLMVNVIMAENINPKYIWSNDLIAEFERMVQQHHESLNSFHRVGSMLEASGKIYALRVDSVHKDVIRMSSGIQRQSIGNSSRIDSIAVSDLLSDISAPLVQPIRRRRFSCTTVVGSKELINSPLQSEEFECPLNGRAGTIDPSVKDLFQYGLCSDRYAWTLQLNDKFWKNQNVVNGLDEFDELNEENVELSLLDWIPSTADVVRPKLDGYQMANSACGHFRLNQPDLEENHETVEMDFHFDVDLGTYSQPSPPDPNISVGDDMRPLSPNQLAYSYRRLTDELSTDAGHWRLPNTTQHSSSEHETTRRRRRRKIAVRFDPVLFTQGQDTQDSVDQNFMSVDDPRTRAIRKYDQRKWKSAKLKMPSRMSHWSAVRLLPSMFGCTVNDEPAAPDVEIDSADDNGIDFRPDDGVEVDMEADVNRGDMADEYISIADVVHIEMAIDWAPNVDDYVIQPPVPLIPFHITPANIDIKAVVRRCLEIICELEAAGGEVTFGQIYLRLQADGQRVTPALVFSSILELANRNNFRLDKIDGTNDFVVKRH